MMKRPTYPYRSLKDHEVVRRGDIVEDITTGKQERVAEGYYNFLTGHRASEARELPGVFDVRRHYLVE